MKWVLVCVVVIAGLSSSGAEGAGSTKFDRECKYDGDCNFVNSQASDTVFLPCEQRKCVCQEPEYKMMDVAFYSVSLVGENCVVKGNAPCGTSKGLTLNCQSGRTCVEGRCRAPGEIKSTPVNHACSETIDCQEGLICKSNNHFPFSSYCTKRPENGPAA